MTTTIASAALGLLSVIAVVLGETDKFDYSPLANIGAVGVVLAWLMWRVEPRMKALEEAIDRNTRSTLLLMVEIPNIHEAVKTQANGIMAETDEAEKRRRGK